MEFAAVGALAIVVAILFNFAQPRVFGSAALQKYQTSYAGKTLFTAVIIFGAIVLAGYVFSAVDGKSPV